ncbi:MAG: hypothetical protein J5786_01640 [Clostridiales bacterium]|nr:hypothetical protein [Clostridiales bacterium]
MKDYEAQIKEHWNQGSDSEWYRSLRSEERLERLREDPSTAFHPGLDRCDSAKALSSPEMGHAVSHQYFRTFETVHVVYSPLPAGYHQATTNREEKLKMNNTSTLNKVLLAIMGILSVIGLVLLSISIFNDNASIHYLSGALSCVGVAGILNVIMLINRKEGSGK